MKRTLMLLAATCSMGLSSHLYAASEFGDADRGRSLFVQRCAVCHGDDGLGQNNMAPNFIEEWHRLSKPDSELAANIRNKFSSSRTVKHYNSPFCPQHDLTDTDMDDLLAYLHKLSDTRNADPFRSMDGEDDFDRNFRDLERNDGFDRSFDFGRP